MVHPLTFNPAILDSALLHHGGQLHDRIPPLDIVVYTLKSILYLPGPKLVSELLHLVSMVEYYRIEVTRKASDALVFNTYYKDNPDPQQHHQLLDGKVEEYYTHLTDTQGTLRKIFIEIVVECCVTASHEMSFYIKFYNDFGRI
jgi:hypothetical protein